MLTTFLLFGGFDENALALANVFVPNVQKIVESAVNYAIDIEDTNTALFNEHYKYTRTRTWVYHNEAGKLTNFKQTQTEENTLQHNSEAAKPPYSVKGRDLRLKAYPITNIITRFEFTLVGEDSVNGRKSYVIEFIPHKNLPVLNEHDPFINGATGKLWVDAADYAISKAQFHLTPPLNVALGLVGQIDAFSCKITRSRTPEGYWFVRRMDWHLDGRLIVVKRVIDYHEDRIHQQGEMEMK